MTRRPAPTAGTHRELAEYPSAKPTCWVRENDELRWMSFGGAAMQSAMSLAAPDRLVLQYTEAMTMAFALCEQPHTLLNLGSGCGAFERFFGAVAPSLRITSVEANPTVARIAREFFKLPAQQPIEISRAEVFLSQHNSRSDLVFCDLHSGAGHPQVLAERSFYQLIHNNLNQQGTLALNLLPRDGEELSQMLAALRQVFRWQYLLEFDDIENIVIFATNTPLPQQPQLLSIAIRNMPCLATQYTAFSNSLQYLPAAPLTAR